MFQISKKSCATDSSSLFKIPLQYMAVADRIYDMNPGFEPRRLLKENGQCFFGELKRINSEIDHVPTCIDQALPTKTGKGYYKHPCRLNQNPTGGGTTFQQNVQMW